MDAKMHQEAPFPDELDWLIERVTYKPGWSFLLSDITREEKNGAGGLTLCIYIAGPDTNNLGQSIRVVHYMPVPPATYLRQSWERLLLYQRWLLDQILLVEQHEACEFFRISGVQPYAPNHGPGWDPYQVRELNIRDAAETTFRGGRVPMRTAEEASHG